MILVFLLETLLVFLILYFILSGIYYLSEVTDKLRTVLHRVENPTSTEEETITESDIDSTHPDTFILTNDAVTSIRESGNCTICTESLGDSITATTCGHIFHPNCLTTWFESQERDNHPTNCPVCRTTIRRESSPPPSTP